jgi:hypothetical protein
MWHGRWAGLAARQRSPESALAQEEDDTVRTETPTLNGQDKRKAHRLTAQSLIIVYCGQGSRRLIMALECRCQPVELGAMAGAVDACRVVAGG